MDNNSKIKAFSLLIDLIRRHKQVSFDEMMSYLGAAGYGVSSRTLERYLADLRDRFEIEIVCNARLYRLDESHSPGLNVLLHFLNLFHSSELLKECIKDKKRAIGLISFETDSTCSGNTYLEVVYHALIETKVISFYYEGYSKSHGTHCTIKPYLLKEYNSRWYLVGAFIDTHEIRTFGIDRMQELEINEQTFAHTEQAQAQSLFDNLIGLVYNQQEPCVIDLSVTPRQARYFRSKPLHGSQSVKSEDEQQVIFTYYLIPNQELQRLILGYGSQIKVIKPQWFAKQIADEITKMQQQYE
jgi:predicted DNA-binding transcriptional regulator YafY